MTNYHIYSRQNWEKLGNKFKSIYLQNYYRFTNILMHSWNLHKILSIVKKMISFIAQLFWKLHSPKIMVPWKFNSSGFRTPFGNQSVNGFQTLLKPAREHFLPNFVLMPEKFSPKKFLLIRSLILRHGFNTLTNYHI